MRPGTSYTETSLGVHLRRNRRFMARHGGYMRYVSIRMRRQRQVNAVNIRQIAKAADLRVAFHCLPGTTASISTDVISGWRKTKRDEWPLHTFLEQLAAEPSIRRSRT